MIEDTQQLESRLRIRRGGTQILQERTNQIGGWILPEYNEELDLPQTIGI